MDDLRRKIRMVECSMVFYGPLFTVDAGEYLELLKMKLEVQDGNTEDKVGLDKYGFQHLKIFPEVLEEILRQYTKWGEQNHDPACYHVILSEEVGECAKEICDLWTTEDPECEKRLRTEMIQVAAVAISAIGCLDRGKWRGAHE